MFKILSQGSFVFLSNPFYTGGDILPTKLITVQRAEKEVKRLMHFINLAENYDADTLEKWVIKEYAFTNSVTEIVKRAHNKGIPLTKEYASSVIKGKATDELHRILKSGYMARITPKKGKGY
jgi:hypothetical protein